ncbi:hypothetical protein LVX13_39210, partial [Streptomyces albulus]
VLEQAPTAASAAGAQRPADAPAPVAGGVVPWVVTARSAAALRGQAERLRTYVETAEPAAGPLDIGLSLVSARARFAHRAVVVPPAGTDPLTALTALDAVATDGASPVVARGVADV